MDDIARRFHFENLKRALEQVARGENVIPMISFLKEDEVHEVTKMGGNFESVLRAIQELMEPDAVNLTIVPTGKVPVPQSNGTYFAPMRILFELTFDHIGNRWISLFEIVREGQSVSMRDVCPNDISSRLISLRTTPEGDLNIRMNRLRAKYNDGNQVDESD